MSGLATAPAAVVSLLGTLSADEPVADVFLAYVYTLEESLYESMDITAFIFGVRCFFAWHRADGFEKDRKAHEKIRSAWAAENEKDYGDWLTSVDDSTKHITWSKWTFQAKSSIFDEWLRIKLK